MSTQEEILEPLTNPDNRVMQLLEEHKREYSLLTGSMAVRAEVESRKDKLTGLLNKEAMLSELDVLMHRIESDNEDPDRYILMYLDLDEFKVLNDTYGHAEGDKVIRSIGEKLKFRESDIAGRLHGDEFLVIVDTENNASDNTQEDSSKPKRRQKKDREQIIVGLTENIRENVRLGAENVGHGDVTPSIGVVEIDRLVHPEKLIEAADRKMYEDKAARKA